MNKIKLHELLINYWDVSMLRGVYRGRESKPKNMINWRNPGIYNAKIIIADVTVGICMCTEKITVHIYQMIQCKYLFLNVVFHMYIWLYNVHPQVLYIIMYNPELDHVCICMTETYFWRAFPFLKYYIKNCCMFIVFPP